MKEPQINLNGWQTIKAIAAKRGCSTQYISQLMRQGKIQFREYPELNGLKLVYDETKKPPG